MSQANKGNMTRGIQHRRIIKLDGEDKVGYMWLDPTSRDECKEI